MRRPLDRYFTTALGVLHEAARQAMATMLRQDIKIADLAETAPFDIKHSRDGDDGSGFVARNDKRAPA